MRARALLLASTLLAPVAAHAQFSPSLLAALPHSGVLPLTITSCASAGTSSTSACTGTYTGTAPTGIVTATWNSPCSGSSTITGFSAAAGAVSFTASTPSLACTGTLSVTDNRGATAPSPAVTITGAFVGFGDIRSGATHYYGVRCYSLAKASLAKALHAVRLDNGTGSDIGLTASCKLDLAAAATLCAGTTCAVDTWYDQIGTAHLLQAGASARPALITTGNGGVTCNGTSSNMRVPLAAVSTPLSFVGTIKPLGGASGITIAHLSAVAWEGYFMQWGPSSAILAETVAAASFTGSTTSATLSTGTVGAVAVTYPSTTSRTAWLNGAAATTDTTSKNPTGQDTLILCSDWQTVPLIGNLYNGVVYEMAYYPVDITSSVPAMAANQAAYGF